MDYLYNELNNLQCLSINELPRLEKLTENNLRYKTDIVFTTPELLTLLRRLCYKFGIIKAAHHFADQMKNNQLNLNFSNLISQGHCLLKQLHDQFSVPNVTKIIGTSIVSELEKIYEKFVSYENQLNVFYEMACKQIEKTNIRLNVTQPSTATYLTNLNYIDLNMDGQDYDFINQGTRARIAPRFNIPNYDQLTCDDVFNQSNKIYETNKNDDFVTRRQPTIQERAGICTKFPGESETHSAYIKPNRCVSEVLTNHGQSRVCKPGYRVNPQPDIKLDGYGPVERRALNEVEQTEYQGEYLWPDGRKIHTSPWDRSREFNCL
ncbi:unnamed protein product [Schistosoma turkestanicum]|nr:unnamed protein product [Schistosoma turkestanicum]